MWLLGKLCCEIRRDGGTVHNISLARGHYVATFLGAFAKLRKAIMTSVVSLCLSAWNDSATTGRVFMKFEYSSKICREKFKFH